MYLRPWHKAAFVWRSDSSMTWHHCPLGVQPGDWSVGPSNLLGTQGDQGASEGSMLNLDSLRQESRSSVARWWGGWGRRGWSDSCVQQS